MTGNELIVDYLTSVPAWVPRHGGGYPWRAPSPTCAPSASPHWQDGEIQFCTATTKDCYREMQAIPAWS